jgi:aspartate carbamoyltransferase catalytic subunit
MTDAALPPLYPHRHLLGIRDLSRSDIELLLERADAAVAISRTNTSNSIGRSRKSARRCAGAR